MGFLMIRLWPIWVLGFVIVLWRLWHLRANGEGDASSTLLARRRWKRALIVLIVVALLSVLVTALESRPQEGVYHPLEWDRDGTLHGATIKQENAE